jgi:hypothetical protein
MKSFRKSVLVCALMGAETPRQGWGAYQRIGAVLLCSHCMLHRQALVTKTMERDLNTVLDDAVKVVNHIKCSPLNYCEEMASEHTTLLLHTAISWLSRGLFPFRVLELRSELYSSLLIIH